MPAGKKERSVFCFIFFCASAHWGDGTRACKHAGLSSWWGQGKASGHPLERLHLDILWLTGREHLRAGGERNDARLIPHPLPPLTSLFFHTQVITKLLYLLAQGEAFTPKETSDVFFAVTKLFQAGDPCLRRMVYLITKDVCPGPDEVIIITSSLMKDMNSATDLYRANAIRVLCAITDPALLGQIERYLKQAVVDKSPAVASAVLVAGTHLLAANPDTSVVRRWAGEVGEAAAGRHPMVQFHAVGLAHALRRGDRLAVSKLVAQLVRGGVRSPLAQCLLVRFVAQVIAEAGPPVGGGGGGAPGEPRPFYDFLESCLRHKAEMVTLEAARAVAALPGVTPRELAPAVSVLQLFLGSSKPVLRFAAARTLASIARTHPAAVAAACNPDLEALITDPNRSVATLAITTLLKTGSEGSVDRLLATVGGFMGDLGDDFKGVVVDAVRALGLKFPAKHRPLMAFLAGALREDGGFEYKRTIVDALLCLLAAIPDAREPGLAHLCEFIEDCEFTHLSTQILHVLGREGPAASAPARYIRSIYNRVILENAAVRAAAVSALSKFGVALPALRPRVSVLLRRALPDVDDEVRDRAACALAALEAADAAEKAAGGGPGGEAPPPTPAAQAVVPAALEAALAAYLAGPTDEPFDLGAVPTAAPPPLARARAASPTSRGGGGGGLAAAATAFAPPPPPPAADALAAVPELAFLGPPSHSTPPLRLTEEETEYAVSVTKHVFKPDGPGGIAGPVMLAFEVVNTVSEQVLEGVSVSIDLADAGGARFEEALSLPAPGALSAGQPATAYVLLRPAAGAEPDPACPLPSAALPATLRFLVKEIDPSTGEAEEGGYEDEYALEPVPIGAADYFSPGLPASAGGDWGAAWEAAGEAGEVVDEYALGERASLADAVEAVLGVLGLAAAGGTDAVPPNARSHTVCVAGGLPGGVAALGRVQFGMDAARCVALKLSARGGSPDAAAAVHQVIAEG